MENYEKLFFCGIGKWDDKTKKFLKENDIGGVILYPSLTDDYPLLVDFFAFIKRENKRILISCDHEGGQLEIVPFVPQFPGNLSLGRNDSKFAKAYAKMSAKILKAVGFNTVFAPVADLYTPKNSAVIGFRTFGSEPQSVTEHSLAMLEGYKEEGILPCFKHFPGHGKAFSDSHEGLVKVDSNVENLKKEDFVPFEKAVKNGAELIMTAHVIYEQLDKLPATLSFKILKEILRNTMGYNGVIISDAMEMKAISDNFSKEEILRLFFNASGNMVLIADGPGNFRSFYDELEKSVKNGEVSEKDLDSSMEKVEKLLRKYTSNEGIGFIQEVINGALEWHDVYKLENFQNVVFLLPKIDQMSQADVLPKHFQGIEREAKKILHTDIIKYDPLHPNVKIEESTLIIDMVIDAYKSREVLDFHRSLPNKATLYVIAHDPYDKAFFEDRNYVVTYSTTPITMANVFKKVRAALFAREGKK